MKERVIATLVCRHRRDITGRQAGKYRSYCVARVECAECGAKRQIVKVEMEI